MGLDIGLKLNKAIASDKLRNQFYNWSTENTSDDIYCLSRGYCNLVMSKHYADSEPLITELNKVLEADCSFIQEPKVNHYEEDEVTKFQFGWISSTQFLDNLKYVKSLIQNKSDFSSRMNLNDDWKYYFGGQDEYCFSQDIDNLIEVIEIGNLQGVTKVCYSAG
jgi:hypothetical protein